LEPPDAGDRRVCISFLGVSKFRGIGDIFRVTTPSELLDRYQKAAEALLDALITLGSRIHTEDRKEYARLRKLVDKCQGDLDQARRDFEPDTE
jgi:hypothetical protein